jgi:cardiolipin synthase
LAIILIVLFHSVAIIHVVITEKDTPDLALVWVLLITFIPVGGLILYYLFDSTYKVNLLPKHRRMEAAEKPFVEEVRREAEKYIKADPPAEAAGIVQLFAANGAYYSNGFDAEVFYDGASMFHRLFEDIEAAKASIQIEFFLFRAKHDLGQKMLAMLSEKAKAGVHVCLLYDRMGDYTTHYRDFDQLRASGASVEQYMPTLYSMLIHSNSRLHRKIIVIDGEVAYTGGINVGDEYVNRGEKLYPATAQDCREERQCVVAA